MERKASRVSMRPADAFPLTVPPDFAAYGTRGILDQRDGMLLSDPDDLALLKYAEAPFLMALPFTAPPNVPADRMTALQTAFMKAHASPEFRAEAVKLDVDVSPIDGTAVAELVAATSRVSPAVV